MKIILIAIVAIALGTLITTKINGMGLKQANKINAKPSSPDDCHKKYDTKTITNEIAHCINEIGK